MPKDNINYRFTDNGVVYDFYDVFVPAEFFNQPTLMGTGNNLFGGIGDNTSGRRSTPTATLIGVSNWKSVTCGYYHTAAIKTDGSLWCWGRNTDGQLGVNDVSVRNTPITTILGGNDWKSVSCGSYFTSAIKTDGSLWCWGQNSSSQLGTNDAISRSTPVATILGGNDWKSVECGDLHTVALKTDGSLWVWGRGLEGQMGISNAISKLTPVTTLLGGNDWKYIGKTRGNHVAAIKTDGTLWLWGSNSLGQIGNNSSSVRFLTPVTTLLGGNNWKSVAGGDGHTVAIKTDGTLWTWGRADMGQLGVGFDGGINRTTPTTTLLGGNNWKSITCGGFHTAAIKTDGTLWLWGWNSDGQLGINENTSPATNRGTPITTIIGGPYWKSVAGGGPYTMMIRSTLDPS